MGYKQQVQRGLDTSPGFLIRSPNAPHQTVLPNWDKETQIRVFPEPHPDGGFKCMREGSSDNDFSDAVWAEPVARSLGVKEQFTYIDRIPGVTGKTPTSRFVEAIISLIEEKPRDVPESWISWIKGGKGRAAKVQKVKTHVFWQGMEIMRKGELLKNSSGQLQPQYPVLVMGAVSLQMSFEELANSRTPDFQGPMPESVPGNDEASRKQRDQLYAQMFQIGDWCSIDHGRIMSIYQAQAHGKFTMNHYAIEMKSEFPLTSIAEHVRQLWVPWEQLLKYHTVEEHIQMLCRAFPPEAVDYAFGSSELRDLLPAAYKDAWKRYRAAESNQVPGYGYKPEQRPQAPPQAPPAQQPQSTGYFPPQTGQGGVMSGPVSFAPPPQTPAPQMYAPPTPPQASAAVNFGGMQVNFSGAPVEGPSVDDDEPPIMQGGGYVTPPEFNQPPRTGAPAPTLPAGAPAPTAPSMPSTPAGAAPAVDEAALHAQLAALKAARDKASRGDNS